MKNLLLKTFAITLAFTVINQACNGQGQVTKQNNGQNDSGEADIFLMISSFNPDTQRTLDFINEFSNTLDDFYPHKHLILIEDMAARNFSEEAHLWKGRVKHLIEKYKGRNLKAVIAIGQEAWAALISQEEIPEGVPIFGTFISSNGLDLPESQIDNSWEPAWINSARKARRASIAGGNLVSYSPFKSVELILTMYPETENIAFITDNSYGGLALKAYFKRAIDKLPQLNYIFLDGRHLYLSQIQDSIRTLPDNSVILLATWKVNKDGQYYTSQSLESLVSVRPKMPVFTFSGTGLGSVAIGGYIPQYNHNAKNIANQIVNYEQGLLDSIRFINDGGWYSFDHRKVKEFGFNPGELPLHSRIVNVSDPRLDRYRNYLLITSLIALALSIFIVILTITYSRNQRLKRKLEKKSAELFEAKEMAEESNRLKSAFLANMSHEIRTPLNAIVGFSNLLAEPDFPEEEKKQVSSIIANNSELLLTLITDILDISGLETGKLHFVFKDINVGEICTQVLNTSGHLKKPGVEYKFVNTEPDLVIRSDAHRLSQVLLNLVTNAAKFTEKGEITLEYKQIECEGKQELMFAVTDTGCGISAEQHYKLFERFGKLDDFKQGAGLGLAISKQIIIKLGGRIWIDPNYTNGARFCFTHPV